LIHTSVYYVPGIIALGVISAAVSNLAVSVTAQRESGILKRRRATPVSASVLITSRALTAAVVALVMTWVLVVIGWYAYSAHIPAAHVLALTVTVLVGAASVGCLGFALTSLIRSADSTHGLVEATRKLPRLRFPFIVTGVMRLVAMSRPFRCPRCGATAAKA
jgi:ABC-2 type transport system permease protein